MSPTVSVVIPCYRQAHFLPDAIESALSQRGERCEIIVVDDGSPDDVPAVVDRYPGVRCLSQENRGLPGARNAGLEASAGSHMVFLDADDRLLPSATAAGLEALARAPSAPLAWGFNRTIDEHGTVVGEIANPWPRDHAVYEDLLLRNVVGPPVGVMFRRSALERWGGFAAEQETAEDYEIYLRLAYHAPIVCHRQVIAEYRDHGSKMSSDLEAMLRGVLRALRCQEPRVAGDPRLRRALRAGVREAWLVFDGARRQAAVGEAVADGRWLQGAWEAAGLAARYPSVFGRAVARKLSEPGRGGAGG